MLDSTLWWLVDVFPVCAGVSRGDTLKFLDSVRFPRMHGGEPRASEKSQSQGQFSPHAWG